MKKLGIIALLLSFGAVMFGVGIRLSSSSLTAQPFNFPQSANELALTETYPTYARCHYNRIDTTSYEWIYAHLNEEDQDLVDAKYIELLLEIDLGSMTEEERLDAMHNLKEELVTYIEDNEFVIGSWR
ncbi:MAG: hypothetical protein CVV58_01230 [Tenericutes bacterium HGW-Tenericutes-3]|jgi:hypothetical protein|nr:MAG: hypothetical protein CVV58_01230 [Tenericutes bacterium HGW-Tenericutes-3]